MARRYSWTAAYSSTCNSRECAVLIRAARPADWPRIWPFWHEIVATGTTYAWAPDTDETTAREIWMRPPPATVFVVVDELAGAEQIVGSAQLQPVYPGELRRHVANASFMVDPAAAGRGIGHALGSYVLDRAREQGYRAMQFNAVVETNVGAVRLWESLGFEIIGTIPKGFQHAELGRVGLHIMHRFL